MKKVFYEKLEFDLMNGWGVNNNKLLKIDIESIDNCDNFIWNKFSEDMLNIINPSKSIIIDVGWYPKFDMNGRFVLLVIKNNEWTKPLETLVTRDVNKIIEKVNYVVNFF